MHEYTARVNWERHPLEAFDDKRYSRRHTIQLDFDAYVRDLLKEIEAGRKRADKAGNPRPVPARRMEEA